jgi:hypothetical protein
LARDFWVIGISLGQAAREQNVLEVRLAVVSDHPPLEEKDNYSSSPINFLFQRCPNRCTTC